MSAARKPVLSRPRMYELVRRPVITEKSTNGSAHGQVTFEVPIDASKPEIKAAVEGLFNVKVKAVNTIVVGGKKKVFRGIRGQRDAGDPRPSLADAEHELGHDEHARGLRLVGERERAEGDETGAGEPDAVVDVGVGGERRPRGGGVDDAAVAAGLDAQRLTEAHDALATAHPEQRMPRVGPWDQGSELIDGFGAHDESRPCGVRRRGIRLGHRTSLRVTRWLRSGRRSRTRLETARARRARPPRRARRRRATR